MRKADRFVQDDNSGAGEFAAELLEQARRVRVDDFDLDRAEDGRAGDTNEGRVRRIRARDLATNLGAPEYRVHFALDAQIGRHDDLDARHDAANLDNRRPGAEEDVREIQ